jgi:hypothetical protein
MAGITPMTPTEEVFDDVNVQKCLFKRAFEIVREEQNKTEDNFISIMDVLESFVKEDKVKEDKIALGWTAISMIRQKKDDTDFTDEEVESLTNNIIKKLKIYLEKN